MLYIRVHSVVQILKLILKVFGLPFLTTIKSVSDHFNLILELSLCANHVVSFYCCINSNSSLCWPLYTFLQGSYVQYQHGPYGPILKSALYLLYSMYSRNNSHNFINTLFELNIGHIMII